MHVSSPGSSLGIPGPLPRLRTPARLRRRRSLLIAAHQLIRHRQPERSEQRLERRPLLSRRAEQRRRPRLASVTGNHKRRGGPRPRVNAMSTASAKTDPGVSTLGVRIRAALTPSRFSWSRILDLERLAAGGESG